MEAATPLSPPRVRLAGDVLAIDALVVTDETAVRLVREREQHGGEAAALVVDAIEIGSRVLDREQAAANTDFVRAEFERQARELEREFGDRAKQAADDLTERLDAVFADDRGTLTRALARHFGDESSAAVQHRVREVVTDVMRGSREEIVRAFTAEGAGNPLAEFKQAQVRAVAQAGDRQANELRALHARLGDLQKEVEGLRAERAAEEDLAAERERGAGKGRDYEELVAEAVAAIASPQGDDAEAVGDTGGHDGRKGDVVVVIGGSSARPRGRLVLEAKDRTLSKKAALEELDGAIANRDADYAIFVAPSGHRPAAVEPLHEIGGDKLFVDYDPAEGPLMLEAGYRLARARVTIAREQDARVDTEAVRARIEQALTALDDFRRLKRELTKATGGIETARGLADGMEGRVRELLDEVDGVLREADAAPGEA